MLASGHHPSQGFADVRRQSSSHALAPPLSPVQGGRRVSWMGRDCYVHTSFSFSSASAPLGFNLACFVIPLYLFYWRIIRLVKK